MTVVAMFSVQSQEEERMRFRLTRVTEGGGDGDDIHGVGGRRRQRTEEERIGSRNFEMGRLLSGEGKVVPT